MSALAWAAGAVGTAEFLWGACLGLAAGIALVPLYHRASDALIEREYLSRRVWLVDLASQYLTEDQTGYTRDQRKAWTGTRAEASSVRSAKMRGGDRRLLQEVEIGGAS